MPKPKDISNVVFYLTDGESLVGVKLDYSVAINDYLQPATLASQIADAVNAAPHLNGYVVVGYTIKAGPDEFDFGTVYEDFGTTGGHPALAEGAYNGRIRLKASEIEDLKPIDLGLAEAQAASSADSPPLVEAAEDEPVPAVDGWANNELNLVADTVGDSQLLGTVGADVFKWTLAEPGAVDTITDFSMSPPADGGDVLDLRDLLPPESAGSLDRYLRFEGSSDGGTLLKVSARGDFNGDPTHDAGVAHQTIELANVDLLSLGSSAQIIDSLISQSKLITE